MKVVWKSWYASFCSRKEAAQLRARRDAGSPHITTRPRGARSPHTRALSWNQSGAREQLAQSRTSDRYVDAPGVAAGMKAAAPEMAVRARKATVDFIKLGCRRERATASIYKRGDLSLYCLGKQPGKTGHFWRDGTFLWTCILPTKITHLAHPWGLASIPCGWQHFPALLLAL